MNSLEDIYKVDIDRAFSESTDRQETIIEIKESRIKYYKEKEQVDSEADTILESMSYWGADYLPRNNKFAKRIDDIINDLWACRDRYLNDNLTFCPKKGY